MNDFNDKIRSALQREAARLEAENDGQMLTIRELIRSTYVGQTRWLSVASYAKAAFFLATAVYATVRFFRAEDVKEMIGWATLCSIGMMSLGMIGTFFFLMANRNAQIREIKRLELLIVGQRDEQRRPE